MNEERTRNERGTMVFDVIDNVKDMYDFLESYMSLNATSAK